MKIGSKTPQASVEFDGWEKIYEVELSSPSNSITISGLQGDTDEQYMLYGTIESIGVTGVVGLTINGDSGDNYSYQILFGTDSTISASRATTSSMACCVLLSDGYFGFFNVLIYAKSGYIRTCLISSTRDVNETAITRIDLSGRNWNNTSDEITSMNISAVGAGNFAIGSTISLYRRISQ